MKIINKKTVSALIFAASFATLGAELHKPNRIVELGFEAEAGASNNYFSAKEFMVKDLVIDLQKIASEIPDHGWRAELFDREKVSFNLNFGERFRLGFFAGLDASGYINVGKELFEFLGEGNQIGESDSVELNGYFDVFLDAGVSFRTKIRDFGISISPSYYVPLIYMPSTTATAEWRTNADGSMYAKASADVRVYSGVDLRRWMDSDAYDSEDNPELNEQIEEALRNGGFDFSLAVEHPIFGKWLEVGGFARIPIIPGTLKYEANRTVSAYIESEGLLKILEDKTPEKDWDAGEWEYSETSHKIYRPLRFGAEAAFRPFGSWLTFRPMIALVMRDPYSSESREVYHEHSLDATLSLLNILSLTVGTAYLNRSYVHHAILAINARVLEIDAGIALRSPDFTKSFMGSGASASLGVKIGF